MCKEVKTGGTWSVEATGGVWFVGKASIMSGGERKWQGMSATEISMGVRRQLATNERIIILLSRNLRRTS